MLTRRMMKQNRARARAKQKMRAIMQAVFDMLFGAMREMTT